MKNRKNNLIEYFKETVLRFPNKVALEDSNGSLTFSELDSLSDSVALQILSESVRHREPIVVLMEKSNYCVAAFIGILKSGNFYVPVDIKSPCGRILSILNTLHAACIITTSSAMSVIEECGFSGRIICVDQLERSVRTTGILDDIRKQIIDVDPIYVIFTSGSTGTPKGVVVTHRGVIDYITWSIETFHITEKEHIGNQAPFYFDTSTLDIYLMACCGATLNIIPERFFVFPAQLMAYVDDQQINMVFWVPSVLINVSNFDILATIQTKSLDKILFAGEVMPNKHLNYWRRHIPDALYANLYGPTEITVICTYYIVDREFRDDEPLPIGKACANKQALILTKGNKPAAISEMGELCIRGSSLALGYFNDEAKTDAAFVQNPLHHHYSDIIYRTGDLVFLNEQEEIIFVGRKDNQIKHMGYRIELGEIETALLSISGVNNTAVLYDDARKKIVAFITGKEDVKEVRKQAITLLPKYMVPSRWEVLEGFPLNANGKIDRLSLKSMLS